MSKNLAVIDLGTNTCNLLIAEIQDKTYTIRYQGKEVVKLGKDGIDKNMLTEDGLRRAIQAIQKHQQTISEFDDSEVLVLATSAIREAKNSSWFQEELERKTGYRLSIISGEKEAELIFKGVKLAFGNIDNHSIILDIGGGSNEFILIENGVPIWKQSFRLGMARVIEQIPPSDPITPEEIRRMKSYFEAGLKDLWKQVNHLEINNLIGCSGAFDTLADLIDQTDSGTKLRIKQEIKLDDFDRVFESLIRSTTAERIKMKGMESIRIEMIVPSVIFIKLVIDRLNIQKIEQTDFALREGVLYEHIFS
jgi:exopolyphosphatase / guanosine-5'-triphosphate,3'-diphosphate pyrophosphatase